MFEKKSNEVRRQNKSLTYQCYHTAMLPRLAIGINPPLPSNDTAGSRLSGIIRLLEKERSTQLHEECVAILDRLNSRCQREGILGESQELADQVLSSLGGRKRGRCSSSSTAQADDKRGVVTTACLDVQLVIHGILRILSMHVDSKDQMILSVLAADYCNAACQYLLSMRTKGRCFLAEFELIASQPLLPNLQGCLVRLLSNSTRFPNGLYALNSREQSAAILASLRATSSLIRLLGTRLTRAPVDSIEALAYQCLAVGDYAVQSSAATLLSTLPLQKNLAEAWQSLWRKVVASLYHVIQVTAPIFDEIELQPDEVLVGIKPWLDSMAKSPTEGSRVQSFQVLLSGLVKLMECLLGVDHAASPVAFVRIPVSSLLDVVEMMVSFSTSAESVFFGTKKRLRAELIDNGIISVEKVVQIANTIKVAGITILSSLLEAVGGPSLMPFCGRIEKIASVAVLTSCSTSLRHVLDAASSMDPKNPRWLHSSIACRTATIELYLQYSRAFGICVPNNGVRSNSKSLANQDVDRSIAFIGGTLVEQLLDASLPASTDWGSFLERCRLLEVCSDCLSACLLYGGEFLVAPTRTLIDSVIQTCLQALSEGTSAFVKVESVRVAFLNLGIACATTSWDDGSASFIVPTLERTARILKSDCNAIVALLAATALSTCDNLANTRVPALHVVTTKPSTDLFATRILSPTNLLERLEEVKMDVFQRAITAELAAKGVGKRAKVREQLPPTEPADQTTTISVVSTKVTDVGMQAKERTAAAENDHATALATKTEKHGGSTTKSAVADLKVGDDDFDDDFPMIVDADPDEEDVT